jgi:hypothetical protein
MVYFDVFFEWFIHSFFLMSSGKQFLLFAMDIPMDHNTGSIQILPPSDLMGDRVISDISIRVPSVIDYREGAVSWAGMWYLYVLKEGIPIPTECVFCQPPNQYSSPLPAPENILVHGDVNSGLVYKSKLRLGKGDALYLYCVRNYHYFPANVRSVVGVSLNIRFL